MSESSETGIARKESRPKNNPVLPKLLEVYEVGNERFPQTHFATNILVGNAVVDAILQGETDWRSFAESELTNEQIVHLSEKANALHGAYEVEKSFSPAVYTQAINNLWEGAKISTVLAAYSFASWAMSEVPETYTVITTEKITRLKHFFSRKKYRQHAEALGKLYSAVADALFTQEAQEVGRDLRQSFKPDLAWNISRDERSKLIDRLKGIVSERIRELIVQTGYSLPEEVLNKFLETLEPYLAQQRKKDDYFR